MAGTAGLGMFFRYSLMPSVSAPMPMAVKKLMLKRVLRGLSIGKSPANAGCRVSSFIRSVSFFIPMPCAKSSNRILMKIREEDVVSSSLRWIALIACHPMASEVNK